LRATYFNNLSVGCFLGGVLIPYLALVQKTPEMSAFLEHFAKEGLASTSSDDWKRIIAVVLAFALAFTGGRYFRRYARRTIALIED
jgi:hypothetical protein